jgi:hypothetical protein
MSAKYIFDLHGTNSGQELQQLKIVLIVERLFTVRGQSLSSSKILTPHPPLRMGSVSSPPPPNKGGGYTLAGRRGGWGGQYFGRRER